MQGNDALNFMILDRDRVQRNKLVQIKNHQRQI